MSSKLFAYKINYTTYFRFITLSLLIQFEDSILTKLPIIEYANNIRAVPTLIRAAVTRGEFYI